MTDKNTTPGSTPDLSADTPKSAAAKLFDIRLLIGGLFTLYGVMLTVAGFFTSHAQRAKASNININLWLGIGMLLLGLLFLLWQRLNPLRVTVEPDSAASATPEGLGSPAGNGSAAGNAHE